MNAQKSHPNMRKSYVKEKNLRLVNIIKLHMNYYLLISHLNQTKFVKL